MNQRNMMKMELTDDQMDKVAGGASAGYTSIASGSFSSNTGTGLNIVVQQLRPGRQGTGDQRCRFVLQSYQPVACFGRDPDRQRPDLLRQQRRGQLPGQHAGHQPSGQLHNSGLPRHRRCHRLLALQRQLRRQGADRHCGQRHHYSLIFPLVSSRLDGSSPVQACICMFGRGEAL